MKKDQKSDHLYLAYHRLGDECVALPCVGEEELVICSDAAREFGAKLVRVVDLEHELDSFYHSCILEGFQKGWRNFIASS